MQKVKKDKKRKSLPVMFDKEAPKPKISRKVTMGNFAFKDLNPVEVLCQCVCDRVRFSVCGRSTTNACFDTHTHTVGATADVDGLSLLQAADAVRVHPVEQAQEAR
jgi:hypothetical protein